MNNENRNKLYQIAEQIRKEHKDLHDQIHEILQRPDEHNGYQNFETFLMSVNLNNTYHITILVRNFLKHNLNTFLEQFKESTGKPATPQHIKDYIYELSDSLKDFIEETFTTKTESIIKIIDYWTYRDFQEINWTEIIYVILEDELKTLGVKKE